MRSTCIILIFLSSSVFAQEAYQKSTLLHSQETFQEESSAPCEHPIIQKAKDQGLNSLTVTEIPQYWFLVWQCKRYAKKTGQEVDFDRLIEQKWQENYNEAKEISGLGSCCITITILSLLYSYFSYFVAGK